MNNRRNFLATLATIPAVVAGWVTLKPKPKSPEVCPGSVWNPEKAIPRHMAVDYACDGGSFISAKMWSPEGKMLCSTTPLKEFHGISTGWDPDYGFTMTVRGRDLQGNYACEVVWGERGVAFLAATREPMCLLATAAPPTACLAHSSSSKIS